MSKLLWQKEMESTSNWKGDRKRKRVMLVLQKIHNFNDEMYELFLHGVNAENAIRMAAEESKIEVVSK